jgi:hypothetical protein
MSGQNGRYDEKRFAEFHARHGRKPFTPVFNEQLEAIRRDARTDYCSRVLAFAVLNAWGRHSDFAADENGALLSQADFVRILQIPKQRVSEAIRSLVGRNLLRIHERALYPVDDPNGTSPQPSSDDPSASPDTRGIKGEDFRRFEAEVWSNQYSDLAREDAELRARRQQIKHEKLRAYKQWKLSQTPRTAAPKNSPELPPNAVRDSSPSLSATPSQNEPPILIEEKRTIKEAEHSPPTPSLEATPAAVDPEVVAPETELWSGFLFAAQNALMCCTVPQQPAIREEFENLSVTERQAAIEGIEIRLQIGEYREPRFIPAALRYIREHLWTAPLKPPPERGRELDRKSAMREEFLDLQRYRRRQADGD